MHDPHGFSFNRKRKADSDDCQDAPSPDIVVDALLVDQPGGAPSSASSACAPRQPCLAPGVIWHSSSSDDSMLPTPSKRPRHDKRAISPRPLPSRRPVRRFPARISPARPPPIDRCGSDVEDIGVIGSPCSEPGPSSGSLLSLRGPPKCLVSPPPSLAPVLPTISLDPSSHHIPPLLPLVNRQSLKELDLDIILRNPQLRASYSTLVSYIVPRSKFMCKGHDLLFDSGLQFRPTGSKRKKELSEKYWNAVITELETGCTCVSFDSSGQPHPTVVCACQHIPLPSDAHVSKIVPSLGIATIRTPSRIRPLLTEFLEVLITVLQPLSSISGMYVNPGSFKTQVQEHSEQAKHIRSIFDPVLIEQELHHRVFDPSGLFRAIGTTLKVRNPPAHVCPANPLCSLNRNPALPSEIH